MYYYRIYGMRLLSDIKFIQLPVLSAEECLLPPQITVTEAAFPDRFKRDRTCYSEIGSAVSYLSNSYCYLLAENGVRLSYEKKESATDALLSAYLLGWGLSMLFYQQHKLAIHCSCVAGTKGAVLLCGDSGSGKSTITTALLERGYSLMADDIVMLDLSNDDTVLALSAFPYQKLCRDAVQKLALPEDELLYIDETKDKFLVPYKGHFPSEPVPVHAIIVLSLCKGDKVLSKELTGVPKFAACMDTWFLRPLLGQSLYAPENGAAGLALASKIPVYHIARPVGIDSKDTVMQEILSYID